jgi:lactate dehydrogenase-like 2-hydroxyacid dehydrogenase
VKKASVAFVGLDVDGKTLGIAGLGRIETNVARKAKRFDMKTIYSDVHRNLDCRRGVTLAP